MRKQVVWLLVLSLLLSLSGIAFAQEVVTLRFSNWDGGETKEAYDAAIAKFESLHPNIKIENLFIPEEYDTKFMAMVASNTTPDIAILESDSIAFPLAEEGKVYNLNEFLDKDPSFKGKLLDVLTYRWAPDKILGYALGPQVTAVFYSIPAFEAAGVEAPKGYEDAWTWDEFVEICKKLTIDGAGKNATEEGFNKDDIVQYGVNVPSWFGTGYSTIVSSMGGRFVTDDGKALAIFDEPEFADAIQKLADLIHVHHVAPDPTVRRSMPGMTDAFLTGNYAMSLNGHWANTSLMQAGVSYGLAPYPVFKKPATRLMGGCLSIMADTKHPEEAWEFYKFMVDPENTLPLLNSGLWLPMDGEWYTNPELLAKWAQTDKHPKGYTEIIVEGMLHHAEPLWQFRVKNFSKIMAVINPAMDAVWLGEKTAKEALESVKDTVLPLFTGVYY